MKKAKLSDQEKGLLKLKNDPSLFVREVLGAEPESWQAEALNAICDHDRVTIKSGHGVVWDPNKPEDPKKEKEEKEEKEELKI